MPPRLNVVAANADPTAPTISLTHRANLPKMPMDFFILLLAFLPPSCLLNLARTSKTLRALLMRRSSAYLWRASRRLLPGLPECPSWMSEPAYANLLFTRVCNMCGKAETDYILFGLHMRLCPKCISRHTIPMREFAKERKEDASPTWTYYISYIVSWGRTAAAQDVCLRTEAARVKPRLLALKDNPQQKNEMIASLKIINEDRQKHACQCFKWYPEYQNAQIERTNHRLKSILTQLHQLGYGKEIAWLQEDNNLKLLRNLPICNSPAELTVWDWIRIKDELLEHMGRIRELRIQDEPRRAMRDRLAMLYEEFKLHEGAMHHLSIFPQFVDIAMFPKVRTVLESHYELPVTRATFTAMGMRALMAEWCANAEKQLTDSVRAALGLPDTADPWRLACAVLTCQDGRRVRGSCYVPLWRWTAIEHSCVREFRKELHPGTTSMCEKMALELGGDYRSMWTHKALGLGEGHQRAREIVRLCGQDPDGATSEQMDALNVRLSCNLCREEDPHALCVLTWRAAIDHYQIHARGEDLAKLEDLWQRLPSRAAKAAIRVEQMADAYYRNCYEGAGHWVCVHCPTSRVGGISKRCAEYHMLVVHEKEYSNDDIYLADNAPPTFAASPIWLISNQGTPSNLVIQDRHARWLETGRAARRNLNAIGV